MSDYSRWVAQAEGVLETDPQLAMRLLETLPDIRSRRVDPSAHGRAAHVRALIMRDRGQYAMALDMFGAARHDLLAAGLTLRALETEIGRAATIREAGDARRSVDIITDLIERLANSAVEPGEQGLLTSLRAQAREQLADGLAALGDHAGAITQYDLAWNSFHVLADHARMARVEGNRAVAYLNQGMLHRALGDLEHACRALGDLGHNASAARFAVPIVRALAQLGRLAEAATLLSDAREILLEQEAAPQLAAIHLALSEILLQSGRAHDARVEAEAAIDLSVQLGRVEGSARARHLIGIADWMSGDAEAALLQLGIAERLFAHERDTKGMATVATAKGFVALTADDAPARAAELAATAVRIARSSGDASLTVRAQVLAACAGVNVADVESALANAETLIDYHEIEGLDLKLALARSRLHRRRGDTDAAADSLRAALDQLEPDSNAPPRSILFPMLVTFAEDELVDILLEIGRHDTTIEAWRRATTSRIRPPTDRLTRTKIDHESEYQAISDAIDEMVALGGVALDGTVAAQLLSSFLERPQAFQRPSSEADGPGRVPVPEGPVLQYHVVHQRVVVFVIRDGLIHARRLASTMAEITDRLVAWYAECSFIPHLDRHDRTELGTLPESDALRALGNTLIDPIADLLEDLAGSRLNVIAHRQLHRVPFEALRMHGRPLYEEFGLSFRYGLHDLNSVGMAAAHAAVPAGSVLVLLNPDARAPHIADDADEVRRVRADASVLVGSAASSVVLAHLATRHDIVHIGCHAFFWPDHPSWSALRLGDRWVTAAELAGMDLRGCLVVLNACATGQIHDAATESVGLVWALLAAGCRGVVSTTWPVYDEVALAFTAEFHARLAGGTSPADAVRWANHAIAMKLLDHPWAWAAYRYVDGESLVVGDSPG